MNENEDLNMNVCDSAAGVAGITALKVREFRVPRYVLVRVVATLRMIVEDWR